MSPIDREMKQFTSHLERDDRSFSEVVRLFKIHAGDVRAFLYRQLGNRADAQEATQEVFLKVWRKEQQGRLKGEARGYLFMTAKNMARDCKRRARTRVMDRHDPLEEQYITPHGPDGEEAVHFRIGLEKVVTHIRELAPLTRQVFALYHGSRLSYPEIAQKLDITPRTVERHMAKCLRHLKKNMKGYP